MRKKAILTALVCAMLLSLTGCQGMPGMPQGNTNTAQSEKEPDETAKQEPDESCKCQAKFYIVR